jgi:hypothetical protein
MSQPDLLDRLVTDLSPVQPHSERKGVLVYAAGLCAALAATLPFASLRSDLWPPTMPSETMLAQLLLLQLSCAAGLTAARMAAPAVGSDRHGWRWSAYAAFLVPMVALFAMLREGGGAVARSMPAYGMVCTAWGLAVGSTIMLALTLWLRRGAPVFPERAGMLVGIAAGAGGSFAYGLHCVIDGVVHAGLWHALPVMLGGIFGRYLLPPLLRW